MLPFLFLSFVESMNKLKPKVFECFVFVTETFIGFYGWDVIDPRISKTLLFDTTDSTKFVQTALLE